MSDNTPGSQGGTPYGQQNQPQYGQNLPQYGQNQPSYGQADEHGQATSPYDQQGQSPYGQQGGNNYPGQQGYQDQPTENPGRTLGIVGFILAIFIAPVGVIVSIVALVKSRKAKMSNGLAVAGIIVGTLITIVGGILLALFISFTATFAQELIEACDGQAAGTPVSVQGQSFECPSQ